MDEVAAQARKAAQKAAERGRPKKHWVVSIVEGVQEGVNEADRWLESTLDSAEARYLSDKPVVEPEWASHWKNKHHLPMRSRDFMEFVVPAEEETFDKPEPWRWLSVHVSNEEWRREVLRDQQEHNRSKRPPSMRPHNDHPPFGGFPGGPQGSYLDQHSSASTHWGSMPFHGSGAMPGAPPGTMPLTQPPPPPPMFNKTLAPGSFTRPGAHPCGDLKPPGRGHAAREEASIYEELVRENNDTFEPHTADGSLYGDVSHMFA